MHVCMQPRAYVHGSVYIWSTHLSQCAHRWRWPSPGTSPRWAMTWPIARPAAGAFHSASNGGGAVQVIQPRCAAPCVAASTRHPLTHTQVHGRPPHTHTTAAQHPQPPPPPPPPQRSPGDSSTQQLVPLTVNHPTPRRRSEDSSQGRTGPGDGSPDLLRGGVVCGRACLRMPPAPPAAGAFGG